MTDKVFRDLTRAELDRNYDQRVWAANAAEIIAEWAPHSALARQEYAFHANLAYGPHPDERLDLFTGKLDGAPVLIWIHGGAWRQFTKDDHSYVVPPFVEAGIHVAVLNFSKAPAARLSGIAAQIRRAVAWIHENAKRFGGDPARIFIGGHSSGAHLAATAISGPDVLGPDVSRPIKAALLVSGSYDLEAVMLSARSEYLVMEGADEHHLSPARHTAQAKTPALIAYSSGDSPEFRRHSVEFADKLREQGRLIDCIEFEGLNHFEIAASVGRKQSSLARMMISHIQQA